MSASLFLSREKAGSSVKLEGKYRNKYTDAIAFQVRSTANTNIVYFKGMLLALKEDSPPYAMDPKTLETIGLWDFDGQLPSLTFTAHPKFDPLTREMVCFGYEAKGDGTQDVCYYSIDSEGNFVEIVWAVAPIAGMIHDFGVTKNYVSLAPQRENCLIVH
jgi:carotenoid cleavage dioxygenase-like enzyme